MKIETRRLIRFGKSSLVLSLPKAWLDRNALKKGDIVYLDEKTNEILVYPKIKDEVPEARIITITTSNKDLRSIWRELNVAYINNFHTIILTGSNIKEIAKELREKIQNLMALEIIEQTSSRIVTKDFLNVNEVSIENIIRKMDIIVRDMLNDAKVSSKEDIYYNIKHRDEDVNKLSFLVFRLVRHAMTNPSIQKKLNVDPNSLMTYWLLATYLENLGDEAKRISGLLNETKFEKGQEEEAIEVISDIEKSYLEIMKAYYTANKERALILANNNKRLFIKCDEFFKKFRNHETTPLMVEKMKNMTAVVHQMGRLVYT